MRRLLLGLFALGSACASMATNPGTPDGDAAAIDGQVDGGADAIAIDTGKATHGTMCGQPGRTCTTATECCSGECSGGYCYDPPIICSADDATCILDSDCCSLSCAGGKCASSCAENGTDCSTLSCCQGSCVSDVCQYGTVGCQGIGKACANNSGCCTFNCLNGTCAAKTCSLRGSTCTDSTDCCTGTCSNGVCAEAPACAWKGSCTTNFQCCTGICTGSQCTLPLGDSACRFLEKSQDTDFAECWDCIATSCCKEESAQAIDWQACFQDCMSDFSTWDAYSTCVASCTSKGPSADLESCATSSCGTACK